MSCRYGVGRYEYYVSPEAKSHAMHYFFGLNQVAPWASTLIRISVAFMLLRFNPARLWQIIFRAIIVFQILATLSFNISAFCQCSPIRANWDIVPDAKCGDPLKFKIIDRILLGGEYEDSPY